jgi:hypothetical protein
MINISIIFKYNIIKINIIVKTKIKNNLIIIDNLSYAFYL